MKVTNLNFWRYKTRLEDGEKLPRKIKKKILGNKLSKNKIRKRINKLELKVDVWSNGYEVPYVEDEFCPKCGCEEVYSTGNMAFYPEVYEKMYCLRCGTLVAMADNSAMIHELVFIKQEEQER
ncbi:hypothetical protein [Clostridium cochlearium]|uniref:Uncharacterized protein n=1 Tax=Clostridium cochlearium TaxID=1494 RepID=A0A2X2VXL7_CLOCO|nr:hypothetical protein [Clostridium cochlearium]SQB33428.1 Uncharacterised protein [Clostridium cochlearium]